MCIDYDLVDLSKTQLGVSALAAGWLALSLVYRFDLDVPQICLSVAMFYGNATTEVMSNSWIIRVQEQVRPHTMFKDLIPMGLTNIILAKACWMYKESEYLLNNNPNYHLFHQEHYINIINHMTEDTNLMNKHHIYFKSY